MHEGNYNYLIKCFVLRALYSKALWIMVFDFICSPCVVLFHTREHATKPRRTHAEIVFHAMFLFSVLLHPRDLASGALGHPGYMIYIKIEKFHMQQ